MFVIDANPIYEVEVDVCIVALSSPYMYMKDIVITRSKNKGKSKIYLVNSHQFKRLIN
jgi:hypothetical protein